MPLIPMWARALRFLPYSKKLKFEHPYICSNADATKWKISGIKRFICVKHILSWKEFNMYTNTALSKLERPPHKEELSFTS